MKFLNTLYKKIGVIVAHCVTALQVYFISLIVSSTIFCVTLSIICLIQKCIPTYVAHHFCKMFLVSAVPLAIIFYILVVFDYILLHKERKNDKIQK